MVDLNLPTPGQDPNWAPQLNAEIEKINVDVTSNTLDRETRPVNVREFGAIGDGVSDDTEAVLSAANKSYASGRPLYFPAGHYVVSETVPWTGLILGDGVKASTISGINPDTPVIATRSWLSEHSGSPTGRSEIRDLAIRGAGTSASANNHGVVLRDYYSGVTRVRVSNTGGSGILMTISPSPERLSALRW